MEHARVVMGSATPSLEAYSHACDGEYLLVKLNARYEERPLPQVSIVDLREELKKGNRSVLSLELKRDLEQVLERREQAMLFLNRRGYAGFVSCRACGHVMKCPHCDVSLSEHNGNRLICHYCGYETVKPEICPSCGSPHIGGFKAGTSRSRRSLKKTSRKPGYFEWILILQGPRTAMRRSWLLLQSMRQIFWWGPDDRQGT